MSADTTRPDTGAAPKPRAECPGCARTVAVTLRGNLHVHRGLGPQRQRQRCPWSRCPPDANHGRALSKLRTEQRAELAKLSATIVREQMWLSRAIVRRAELEEALAKETP